MYKNIINFWFEDIDQAMWWQKNNEFDGLISNRFSTVHQQACQCELYRWRTNPEGRLAEIIVLDQFSRNIYRNSPLSFSNDALALALAQEAIANGADKKVSDTQRSFFYLPFMHSESTAIHELAVKLYGAIPNGGSVEFERKHKAIIDRFGRYPHRNVILGRQSTDAELAFLSEPNSSF